MNKQTAAAIIISFIAGMILVPKGKTETIEVPEQCEECSTMENIEIWMDLKAIDDRAFDVTSDAILACSDMIEAQMDSDIDGMTKALEEIEELTPQISTIVDDRLEILSELGY